MDIRIGDRIKFKAATRWNCGAVWRKVNGFRQVGSSLKPTVRYGGWPNFTVRADEILEVIGRDIYVTSTGKIHLK